MTNNVTMGESSEKCVILIILNVISFSDIPEGRRPKGISLKSLEDDILSISFSKFINELTVNG